MPGIVVFQHVGLDPFHRVSISDILHVRYFTLQLITVVKIRVMK